MYVCICVSVYVPTKCFHTQHIHTYLQIKKYVLFKNFFLSDTGEKIAQNQLTIGVKLNKTHTLENIEIVTNLGIGSTS